MKYFNGANCDGIPFFYNSNGERLNLLQEVNFDKFLAESTFIELVWSCAQTNPPKEY
ncbi:hypothetical protein [Niastella vici]|uniref:hypothetical protein n=1 Tax=Niastella vici TaxID=1703345 RepID=UPI001301C5E9|nr:hypothetical protein [Niastella vici]